MRLGDDDGQAAEAEALVVPQGPRSSRDHVDAVCAVDLRRDGLDLLLERQVEGVEELEVVGSVRPP